MLRTWQPHPPLQCGTKIPWHCVCWTSQMPCHPDPCPAGLLVAGNGHIYLKLCWWLCYLPAAQDQPPPYLPATTANLSRKTMTVLPDHYGFHHKPIPSDGYDSIMAMVDQGSSKRAIFMPCNKTIDAIRTATLLLYSLYSSLQNCPNVWHVETNWLVTQKIHMLRFWN